MTPNRRTPAEQDLIDTASKLIRARDSRINTERTMRRLAKALQAVRAEEQNTGAVDASPVSDGQTESCSSCSGHSAASVPHSAQADALSSLGVAGSQVSAMGASPSNPGGSAKASAGGFSGRG